MYTALLKATFGAEAGFGDTRCATPVVRQPLCDNRWVSLRSTHPTIGPLDRREQ